jgi:hypothetical protein
MVTIHHYATNNRTSQKIFYNKSDSTKYADIEFWT